MANFDEQAALLPASVDGGDLIDLGHQLPYLPPTAPQDFRLEDIDNFSLGAVSQRDSDATDRSINGSSLPPGIAAGDEAAVFDPAEGDEATNGVGNASGQEERLVAAGESATKTAEAVKPKVLKRMTKEEFEESLGIKQKKKTDKKASVKKTPPKKAVTKKGAKKSEKTISKVAKGVKKAALKAAVKKNAKTKEESTKKTSVSFEEPKSSPAKKTTKGVKKIQKKASKGILKKNTKTAKKAASKTLVSGRTAKR
ncbi:hypothetical protein PRIPAC_95474 [Pristionchus pacificus]|uniref:Uncharacterized protein n=1 Tax=Pristionchus pacificus TaxID=54126 RepID=A0A454XRV9_PRIPA|nr:hypothetical protein PRIPAC_95474 [Pristionchus pacificus]|eukprot:PDM63461.1 hypothetical protein PRIPAC_53818 [Pristionchus pacificus]